MFRKIITKEALKELNEISNFIAEDNLFFALKVIDNINETINTITIFPYIWKKLNENHRIIIEPQYKYKIIYRIEKEIIYIVSVFKYKNEWEN